MGENGEKKSLKIRLSTVFLMLALIIIGILCCTIYIQKQDYTKQIAYLEDQITLMSTNSVSMQATIDNLEGKLGAIANVIAGDDAPAATNEVAKNEVVKEEVKNEVQTPTTTEAAVKPDFIYTTEDLSKVDYKTNASLDAFFAKHLNKTMQITGYLTSIEEDDVQTGYYIVNIGKQDNYESFIYGSARITKEAYEKVKDTSEGSVVAITGTLKEASWPVTLDEGKIVSIEQ